MYIGRECNTFRGHQYHENLFHDVYLIDYLSMTVKYLFTEKYVFCVGVNNRLPVCSKMIRVLLTKRHYVIIKYAQVNELS